jgi:TRAP-type mannitol/chloroaromatic compound transport system permease small subunit
MSRYIVLIDRINEAIGKAFGWSIIVLTFAMSYEVFVRYVLNAPTQWAYDISYVLYGALFIMSGAYTLSRNGHVRGDVLYRLAPPRVQAGIDLALYLIFFFPGVIAIIYAGWPYAERAWRYHEVSVFSPAGIPVYPLKTLIPLAGALLFLQGLAEIGRCLICLQIGRWPARTHDVEEMEKAILRETQRQAKEEARNAAQDARNAARGARR